MTEDQRTSLSLGYCGRIFWYLPEDLTGDLSKESKHIQKVRVEELREDGTFVLRDIDTQKEILLSYDELMDIEHSEVLLSDVS
jgi:hypothetical protein